jgi:Ca2+-binding EF-hand superfamily protein
MGSKNGKPVLREEDVAALVKSSGLDETQVKESFEAFIAEHPNGKMKPKDFREMMSKALPKKDASKMEKHVFRIYDSNNDGYIDFSEFMLIFFIMSDGTPEEVLTKIFRVFDVNSDGTITQKEMTKLIKDMYGLLKSEDPNLAAKDLVSKSAFAEMDKDQDGKVTTEEFITACMGQDDLSKMLALKVIDIFVEDDA